MKLIILPRVGNDFVELAFRAVAWVGTRAVAWGYTGEGHGPDHDLLYSGKATTFKKVGDDVANTISNNVYLRDMKRRGMNSNYEQKYKTKSQLFRNSLEGEQKAPRTPTKGNVIETD